jgi:hypothetical protein
MATAKNDIQYFNIDIIELLSNIDFIFFIFFLSEDNELNPTAGAFLSVGFLFYNFLDTPL